MRSRAGEYRRGRPGRCLTRIRARGYSPLDFPLFGRFVLGVLGTEQDLGEEHRMRASFEVENLAQRRIRDPG
jgi:hypothetical protein